MKIIKNNGTIPELKGSYILKGFTKDGNREMYAKLSIGSVIDYILIKIGAIKVRRRNES